MTAIGMKRLRCTPEEARRVILEAARQLIARTGPAGLRLQDVAVAAGVSHPLILHHFGSREGLVRALTQEAAVELRDRLVASMSTNDNSPELQLDRVFDVFRNGLAQRLAWLAATGADAEGTAMVMRDIADAVHARRLAAAPPGAEIVRADTEALVHLIAVAAFGDAIFGPRLRRSAGLPIGEESERGFRRWLATLIREHTTGNTSPN